MKSNEKKERRRRGKVSVNNGQVKPGPKIVQNNRKNIYQFD